MHRLVCAAAVFVFTVATNRAQVPTSEAPTSAAAQQPAQQSAQQPAQQASPQSSQQPEAQDYEFHSPHASKPQNDFSGYLFGDWIGARSALAQYGISVAALVIADPFGNVSGGERRGTADYNLAAFGVILRTDKLLGWRGGQFHVGFAVNFGTSLSKNYTGNSFPIQLADVADPHPRLTYLSWTQSLLEGRLSFRLGRLTINSVSGEEFMGSRYFKAFSSVGIDLVPLGLFLNAPGAFGYPDTTWGARVKVQPVEQFYAMAGVYNGDPRLKNGALHGVDFSVRGPVFLIGEIGMSRNSGKGAAGLPGNLKLGGFYNGGTAQVFAPSQLFAPSGQSGTEHGRSGLYVVADQALRRWGDSAQDRRLGAFVGFTASPDQRVNRVPYFFDTGLVMFGPSSKRPRDLIGLGVVYGSYSQDLRTEEMGLPNSVIQNFEMTLELNYGWEIRPGLLVQPSAQYIVQPSGNKRLPNALAIGINLVLNL